MKNTSSGKIKVNGKTLNVFEAGFVHGLQRSVLIAEAGKGVPKFYEKYNLSTDVVRYVHQLLYPSLISCTEGPLPTEEEFLSLKDKEVNEWINTAQEKNEDWFSLNGADKGSVEKKESKPS
jgi:hypothetical protein